jgi:hypothetical protein
MGDFLVNTTTNSLQFQPAIAPGGGYNVVWTDKSDGHIKGQFLQENGAKGGGEFIVSTAPSSGGAIRQWPTVAAVQAGLAVAWVERAAGPASVQLQIMDGDRKKGSKVQVSTAEIDPDVPPSVAATQDGGFVLVWAGARVDERIRVQHFDDAGRKTGAEFTANTTEGRHLSPVVSVLINGDYVIVWESDPVAIAGGTVTFRSFAPSGAPKSNEIRLNRLSDVQDMAVTMLDNGRFVVTHVDELGPSDLGVQQSTVAATVLEENGAEASSMQVGSPRGINRSSPAVTPLPNGRFMIAWVEKSADTFSTIPNVMAKVFSDTQGTLGDAMQVSAAATGDRFQVCAASNFDGGPVDSAFVAWADDSHTDGDTSDFAVRGRALTVIPPGTLA